jgi:hypothetical protein
MKNNRISLNLKYVTILIALVILFDHFYPGKSNETIIQSISANYQPYFNAGGNGHYSYAVSTPAHQFYVREEEADLMEEGQKVSYKTSLIFNEVQVFETSAVKGKKHSLFIFTGVVIPLLSILVMLASIRYKKSISTLTFVIQVCTIGDLVFLLQ